jgi:hypothetical protein
MRSSPKSHGVVWQVSEEDAGLILDKFLAAEGRLGSRSKAAAARERGKVFLNGRKRGAIRSGRR